MQHKKNTKILVVEDDPKIRGILISQLGSRGFDVRSVPNGMEAVAQTSAMEPDVILLDLSLPGINGPEVCRTIRKQSEVPILLVTATDLAQTKTGALECGADDYLTKPFHMGELIARIRSILRRVRFQPDKPAKIIEFGDLCVDMEVVMERGNRCSPKS